MRQLVLMLVLVSIAWVGLTAHAALPTEGLVLRYETVGDSPYTLVGNSVTSWTNQAGTVDAVSVGNSAPSLLVTATPLGMPALYFDGDAKYLEAHAIAALDNKNTLSWFVVFKADQLGVRTTIRTGYTNNRDPWGSYLANDQFQQHTRTAAGGWAGINPPFTDTVNWHVSSAVWNGTAAELNGNAATTFYSFLNGMELGSRSDATFVPQQHTLTGIGATNTSSGGVVQNFFWDGMIAAILVYDTALSAEDRKQVEAYLEGTYLSWAAVYNYSPADKEMGVDPEGLVLNWDAPVGAEELVVYDLYLGTAVDPNMFVSQGQTATHYIVPDQLSYGTTYSWRVDVRDADTSDLLAAGDVWSFTTGGGVWNPSPAVGQRVGYPTVPLSWDSALASSFDVYLGSSPQALLWLGNTIEQEFLAGVDPNETYYWRVDTRDSEDNPFVTGPVWQFETGVLLAHWKMDDGSGEILTDAVGAHDGDLINFGETNQWTTGAIRGALNFPGGGTYTQSPYVSLESHGAKFGTLREGTIAAWVKPTPGTLDTAVIFAVADKNASLVTSRFFVDQRNGNLSYDMLNGPANGSVTVTGANLTDGNWHHVAITVTTERTATLYVDGVARASGSIGFLDVPGANFASIGGSLRSLNANPLWFYSGLMDDLRLFNFPLTPLEVQDLYYGSALATNPDPVHNATRVPVDITCQWDAGHDITGQVFQLVADDPYFEQENLLINVSIGMADSYTPSGLDFDRTYYWRIISEQDFGTSSVTGNTWSFTTIPPIASEPDPADGAVGVPQNKILSWLPGAGFDTGDSHEVYIAAGTADDLPVVPTATVSTEAFKPDLAFETAYVWRVDEVIGGVTNIGDVWTFTTGAPICDPPLLGDLTGNCVVNLEDFALMAAEWLDCTLINGDCP